MGAFEARRPYVLEAHVSLCGHTDHPSNVFQKSLINVDFQNKRGKTTNLISMNSFDQLEQVLHVSFVRHKDFDLKTQYLSNIFCDLMNLCKTIL